MNIQGIIQEVATTPEEHLSCNFLFFFLVLLKLLTTTKNTFSLIKVAIIKQSLLLF